MFYSLIIKDDPISLDIANHISERIQLKKDDKNPDIVICVGGDGTILQAAHKFPNAIIFGLHTGHLGFFANYNPDNVDELIDDVNNGTYQMTDVSLLSCKIEEFNGNEVIMNALNEITVISPSKTLILDVNIDDDYLETFRGTGLCVSTPSGSTAYNKSLHGAVVDHDLECMQLAEIASINSNAYRTLGSPLVLSSKRRITLESNSPLELSISIDHLSYHLKEFKKIQFFFNEQSLKMGYHSPEGFIKRIARTFIAS